MTARVLDSPLLHARRPPRSLGVLVAVGGVALATGLVYPLKHIAPVESLGVVYLVGVILVSTFWGLGFGVATAILSVIAFSFFHLPPVGRFTLADSRDWVGLCAFAAVAVATGLVADLARARAREAEDRRAEADLARDLAQLLLGAGELGGALDAASRRLAEAVGVERARIELAAGAAQGGEAQGDEAQLDEAALPLHRDGVAIGTLLLDGGAGEAVRERVRRRIVPSLESVLAAALHRAELQAEVVETAALRRSDEMKTAVLRSVSHDLRTPVTAILTAAGALDAQHPDPANVAEVRELVLDAATRLWRLIEKLLDLSLLQAGRLEPGLNWCSIDEVLQEAIEQTRAERSAFSLSVDRDLPLMRADAAQLERAFANVLENAVRYSAGKPVSVRARAVGQRVRVRIVDQGPGIAPAERERVFLPFYRAPDGAGGAHHGSGLGLAIAKGFIEVNAGRITIESQPGQGTSFVIEFPLPAPEALEVPPAPGAAAPASAAPAGS